MYKAKIDIGGFKKGEVIPNEIAEVWMKMYKVSPVEKVEKKENEFQKKKKSRKKLKK